VAAKRIVVLYKSSLLAQGLQVALRDANGSDVHGLDLEAPGVLDELAALAPHAVVIDPRELKPEIMAEFISLVLTLPLECVVSLRWGENAVDVLRKERVEVAKARDVLAAVVGMGEAGLEE
jgi:hypothetical protein